MRTGRKSKQTKAHEISRATKQKVWERQHGKSIFSPYKPITVEMCCCHFRPRSAGGLGEEWNIFGCFQTSYAPGEHDAFDGRLSDKQVEEMVRMTRDEMKTVVRNHLIRNYNNWSYENCKYEKYKEDYGVTRREK